MNMLHYRDDTPSKQYLMRLLRKMWGNDTLIFVWGRQVLCPISRDLPGKLPT